MQWFVKELGALTAAESCCLTLHNTYTLRTAPTRDPLVGLLETFDTWFNVIELSSEPMDTLI